MPTRMPPLVLVPLLVGASGCLSGVGPTLALRATGPDRGLTAGFDLANTVEVHEGPPTYLAGFEAGFESATLHTGGDDVGPSEAPPEMTDRPRGYFAVLGQYIHSSLVTSSADLASVAGGVTTSYDTDTAAFVSASAGVLGSVGDHGFTGSIELGVRWTGALEVYVAPRLVYALCVGISLHHDC